MDSRMTLTMFSRKGRRRNFLPGVNGRDTEKLILRREAATPNGCQLVVRNGVVVDQVQSVFLEDHLVQCGRVAFGEADQVDVCVKTDLLKNTNRIFAYSIIYSQDQKCDDSKSISRNFLPGASNSHMPSRHKPLSGPRWWVPLGPGVHSRRTPGCHRNLHRWALRMDRPAGRSPAVRSPAVPAADRRRVRTTAERDTWARNRISRCCRS